MKRIVSVRAARAQAALVRALAPIIMCAALALGGGCAGQQLESNVREVRAIAKEAREAGAYKCAPRELALAEANIEFATRELDQGDYFRARDHVHIADRNARLAYQQSHGKCDLPPGPADRDRDGILDDVDKCPDQPEDKDGFEDEDGCPEPDNDKDGLADTSDKCPNEPEDKDKFEDEDGCPDPDNDTDGIADVTDKCPVDPEDKDAFEDEDGCPDADNDKDGVLDAADRCPNEPGPPDNDGCPKKFQHIVVTQEKIELKQKIFFDTNKATIQPRSFGLLDEIGSVLKSRPTMTVRIEGHTDSRGKRAHNMQLSQARAESVRQHLVGLGIDPARMEAKGYGPDQPIETNKTVAGREKNRRVEFIITKQ
jgi:outer membrane protein OmpA-like peptidoglycan-associated protein